MVDVNSLALPGIDNEKDNGVKENSVWKGIEVEKNKVCYGKREGYSVAEAEGNWIWKERQG